MKPRILVVTPCPPIPLDAGNRRVWSACSHLKEDCDFHLFSLFRPVTVYYGGRSERMDAHGRMALQLMHEERYFAGVFKQIHYFYPEGARPAASFNGLALPEEVGRCFFPEAVEKLLDVIAREKIELVQIEFDLMAAYAAPIKERFPDLPCLVTLHDLGSASLFRSYMREMADWKRFLRLGNWRRWRRYLRGIGRRFDRFIVLTDADAERLSERAERSRIRVVPTGVDLRHFASPRPFEERRPDTLVYVGHYPHYPNEDAVSHCVKDILPRVWREIPEARLNIVGSGPARRILDFAKEPRITVTGAVDDVKPYEEEAAVMVAPLRLGLGIKGKILEGFAAGTPVVATSLANEGIRARPQEEILIGDSPRAFAAQIVRLLRERPLWQRLSQNGRRLAEREHGWERRARQLKEVYAEFLCFDAAAPAAEKRSYAQRCESVV